MVEKTDTKLGYCRRCKKFDRLVRLHYVEASPFGMKIPMVAGLFFEDELEFIKDEHGWIGISISKEAFKSCEFEYAEEEKMTQVCKVTGNEVCPFHCYNFDWSCDTYNLIDCDCMHREFNDYMKLREHASEVCPCIRDEEFYDFSNVEYSPIYPIEVEDHPSSVIVQKKLPGALVIPTILKATTFVHIITYNIDNYFLGILQTLAVKGVDVIIVLNPSTLTKGKLKTILNIASYSRGKLQILANNKVHAKRVFIDGIYDLDLASINLSYNALYDQIENIPELSFAAPSLSEKNWEVVRDIHNEKFLSAFKEGQDIFEWCKQTKRDVYKECVTAFARREKENELIKKMQT
jgi:hypothetical protein